MAANRKKQGSWSEVKGQLKGMPTEGLLGVIQDLYALNKTNRAFLETRFVPGLASVSIEEYRKRVQHPFYPERGMGKLEYADAKRAIREYEQATSDLAGTLDLMLSFVEAGNRFTQEFGDIDEQFYNTVEGMMFNVTKRFRMADGKELYPQFAARLQKLYDKSRNIGWGYSDEMADMIVGLQEEFGGKTAG